MSTQEPECFMILTNSVRAIATLKSFMVAKGDLFDQAEYVYVTKVDPYKLRVDAATRRVIADTMNKIGGEQP